MLETYSLPYAPAAPNYDLSYVAAMLTTYPLGQVKPWDAAVRNGRDQQAAAGYHDASYWRAERATQAVFDFNAGLARPSLAPILNPQPVLSPEQQAASIRMNAVVNTIRTMGVPGGG